MQKTRLEIDSLWLTNIYQLRMYIDALGMLERIEISKLKDKLKSKAKNNQKNKLANKDDIGLFHYFSTWYHRHMIYMISEIRYVLINIANKLGVDDDMIEKLIGIDAGKIDWKLLQDQKITLLSHNCGDTKSNLYFAITGIIGFIDYIQDAAVDSGKFTEEEIFNLDRRNHG